LAVLRDLGVSVDVPPGWDGRIYRRDGHERERAVLHLSTVPLPAQRGDYGSGAVEQLSADDVLVVLVEFDPTATQRELFDGRLPTAVDGDAFDPAVLQRVVPGQAGAQWFFSTGGRAFCLYVVLGQHANRRRLVRLVNEVLRSISIDG
jgi:hypothetical protein